ncbi:MAG: ABC transporter permease [Pseudomonadota bacterium]
MKILDRKLRRDLWQSKGILAAIVAIVAVGIGCLVGMAGTSKNLEIAKNSYYAQCRMADFWIDLKKAPISEVEQLSRVPGVSDLRHRISYPVIIDLEGVDQPLSGKLLSLPEHPEPVINNIIIRSGNYFTGQRENEVIVSESFAKARKIGPGDNIDIVMNKQRKRLFVVGTAISSETVYMTPPGAIVPEPAKYGVFYVKRHFASENLGFQGACNNIVGLLTPDARQNPQAVLDEIEQRLNPYGVFAATPLSLESSNLALTAELGGLATMAFFMPVIFLSVAALVLNVLMTRMAQQQRTIVGTLKALGYRNREIFSYFLKIGVIVGLAGAATGSELGYWIAYSMTYMYSELFTFPSLHNEAYPGLILLSAIISVVFAVLGTARGVNSVIKLSPAEAMHQSAPVEGGGIILERWGLVWKRLGFRWQMVLRNLFRNKGRTLVGIFAAAMGSALLVATFGTLDSLKYMVVFQFDKVMLSDYTLTFRNEQDFGAVYEAKELPGVKRVEPILNVSCTFYKDNHQKKGMIQGLIPGATMTVPRDGQGNAVTVPTVGLLMNRRLATILDVGKGDYVRMVPTKGDQRPVNLLVADIVESMFGMSVYADYNYLNRLVDEAAAVSRVQLKAQMTTAQQRDFLRAIKRYPELQTFGDTAQEEKIMEATFVTKMAGEVHPLILFGAVIFFGSILNASLIAIVERQREIATFRVLGYQRGEIGSIFLRENLLQNMLGAFLGLPLGWWLLKMQAEEFTNDMYSMPCIVSTSSWFYSIGLAFLFVIGAQFIVQRAINAMDWNEALNVKE